MVAGGGCQVAGAVEGSRRQIAGGRCSGRDGNRAGEREGKGRQWRKEQEGEAAGELQRMMRPLRRATLGCTPVAAPAPRAPALQQPAAHEFQPPPPPS
eukprot:365584-Chlamydomonas_euryale.AAC.11